MSAALPPVLTDVLLPAPAGVRGRLLGWGIAHLGAIFAILRRLLPIVRVGKFAVVTLHDDVREVFSADADFPTPYTPRLNVIMGGQPFLLGMGDTPDYRRDAAAMRAVVRPEDIPARLIPGTLARAEALVAAARGRIEVVDQLARNVTFDVLCPYFGFADTADAALRVWATRLFTYQFADDGSKTLHDEVAAIAPALRAHIDGLIAVRRGRPAAPTGADDVLGRCLAQQAQGAPGFSDAQIRAALIGFLVGGLPQWPMAVPQALNQLLLRPAALAGACAAAAANDDASLCGHVFEALRFDPLAPAVTRLTARDHLLAAGTKRATTVAAGTSMTVALASAMMDPRRVRDPARFDPARPAGDYFHFGDGLHTCFAQHINRAVMPLVLKPLLLRPNLKRAGKLVKRGVFASELWVTF